MPRRLALFSLWLAVVVTGAVGCDDARQAGSVSSTPTSLVASEECKPAFLSLPALVGHQHGYVTAMNDAGLAVGYSGDFDDDSGDFFYRSVMWRDDNVAIDLGIGGRPGPGNFEVSSAAVHVNEQGEVVSYRFEGAGKAFVKSSWLWRDGVKVRLRATKNLPWANVEALNERSVAVGYLEANDGRYRPWAWVDGKPTPLPIPEGATGRAKAINNNNLIVGEITVDAPDAVSQPWFWRLNGRSGPLPTRPPGQTGAAIEVNNNNHILGSTGWTGVVWPDGPSSMPYSYGGLAVARAADMNDHGDLTGTRGWGRDDAGDAWVSRIGAKKAVNLPDPFDGGVYGVNSFGMAVIRGSTWFAPDGGVSVGGAAGGGNNWHATIWTCTQTYRH